MRTVEIDGVAGNDALQTLMRISPLGIPFNDAWLFGVVQRFLVSFNTI